VLKEFKAGPRGLKPLIKNGLTAALKALRHPKSGVPQRLKPSGCRCYGTTEVVPFPKPFQSPKFFRKL